MSGGLYQKPGHASTEYRLTRAVLVASALGIVAGAAAAYWLSAILGIALIASGTVTASSVGTGYALSRARVKAAAESNRPPQSRVC